MRTIFLNGHYVREDQAQIPIFDRGLLMADGVYEVTTVINKTLVDFDAHMARLENSLAAIDIPCPYMPSELLSVHKSLIRANKLVEGLVYLQVTRGQQERDFVMPENPQPTVFAFTQAKTILDNPAAKTGIRVISMPDARWLHRDVKSIQLLSSSLAKTAAVRQGKDDVWFVEDGLVTEGSTNNAFIVTRAGKIVTRDLGKALLPGVTRAAVLQLAAQDGLDIEERAFSIAEAQAAAEAFITSATTLVLPVVEVDGVAIGDGHVGPMAKALRGLYLDAYAEQK